MIHLCIRGFGSGRVRFEDKVDVDERDLGGVLPALAEQHAAELASHRLQMIEIEFLDEPDPEQRFFRMGTDPSLMRRPIQITMPDAGGVN